jgi:hypothetical protein
MFIIYATEFKKNIVAELQWYKSLKFVDMSGSSKRHWQFYLGSLRWLNNMWSRKKECILTKYKFLGIITDSQQSLVLVWEFDN